MRGLDNWITSGRYSESAGYVMCKKCGYETFVVAETEYGATTWTPEECSNKKCLHTFDGDEEWTDAEPPEQEYNLGDEDYA